MKYSACFRLLPCLLLGLTLVSPVVRADDSKDRPAPKERAGDHMKRMVEELGLTDAQKTAIIAIMQKQRAQLEALRADESLSRRDKMQKQRELREASRAEIRAQLTPEQQKKFDDMPPPRPRKG